MVDNPVPSGGKICKADEKPLFVTTQVKLVEPADKWVFVPLLRQGPLTLSY